MTAIDRVKGAVFLLAGLGLLVAAVFNLQSTRDWLRRSRIGPGIVIAEDHGPHHVRVSFRTAEGRVVTYAQNGDVTLYTGERVPVRYDPRRPAMSPSVDRFGAIWGTVLFLGIMGTAFTAFGLGGLLGKAAEETPR